MVTPFEGSELQKALEAGDPRVRESRIKFEGVFGSGISGRPSQAQRDALRELQQSQRLTAERERLAQEKAKAEQSRRAEEARVEQQRLEQERISTQETQARIRAGTITGQIPKRRISLLRTFFPEEARRRGISPERTRTLQTAFQQRAFELLEKPAQATLRILPEGRVKRFLGKKVPTPDIVSLGKFLFFQPLLATTPEVFARGVRFGEFKPQKETTFVSRFRDVGDDLTEVGVISRTDIAGREFISISKQQVKKFGEGVVGKGRGITITKTGTIRTPKITTRGQTFELIGGGRQLGRASLVKEFDGIAKIKLVRPIGTGVESRVVFQPIKQITTKRSIDLATGKPFVKIKDLPRFEFKGGQLRQITQTGRVTGSVTQFTDDVSLFVGKTGKPITRVTRQGVSKILRDIDVRGVIQRIKPKDIIDVRRVSGGIDTLTQRDIGRVFGGQATKQITSQVPKSVSKSITQQLGAGISTAQQQFTQQLPKTLPKFSFQIPSTKQVQQQLKPPKVDTGFGQIQDIIRTPTSRQRGRGSLVIFSPQQLQKEIQKQAPILKTQQAVIPKQKQLQKQIFKLPQALETKPRGQPRPIGEFGFIVPPPIIFPFLPPIFPSPAFRGTRRPRRRGRKARAPPIAPAFTAIVFDIEGILPTGKEFFGGEFGVIPLLQPRRIPKRKKVKKKVKKRKKKK